MGLDHTVGFVRYGERFKKLRRLILQPLNAQNSTSFQAIQRNETYVLLRNILVEPIAYESHIERLSHKIILVILMN